MAKASRGEWAKRVRGWRASGLTARAFAAREGFNANTLSWWSSRLRSNQPEKPAFVDVTALVSARPDAGSTLEVVIRNSVSVRVERGFDAELLRAVVAALEAR